MLSEILALNVFGFFLIFARVGAAFVTMPGFSAIYVGARARLLIALTVSFLLTPVLAGTLPGVPETPDVLAILLIGEVVVGLFLGILGRILVAALQTAGTLVSLFSSMANALIQDPIVEQQSSVAAGFLSTLGIVLIFVTDLHHVMLGALADSYTLFVPGRPLMIDDMANVIARRVMDSFALGVQLASPLFVTGLTYYLGLGLLGRLMPALPIFFVGLPAQVMIQISVFMLTLSSMMMVFLARFQDGYAGFLTP